MDAWIHVNELLPDDHSKVIAFGHELGGCEPETQEAYFCDGSFSGVKDRDSYMLIVTYWQPMPEDPK